MLCCAFNLHQVGADFYFPAPPQSIHILKSEISRVLFNHDPGARASNRLRVEQEVSRSGLLMGLTVHEICSLALLCSNHAALWAMQMDDHDGDGTFRCSPLIPWMRKAVTPSSLRTTDVAGAPDAATNKKLVHESVL